MDLYRGKAKTTGDWIVGAAVVIGEKAHILGSESLFPERPAYHRMAMGCGIEDRNLRENGYEAAEYGWEEALERYEENFPKWIEVEPETVTRCCDKHDVPGNVLFEGEPNITNAWRIQREFQELRAVMDMLIIRRIISPMSESEKSRVYRDKVESVEKWERYSESIGKVKS